MNSSRPNRIVNLASAIVVLAGGFYILFFMPVALSPFAKLVIAVMLVIYFLWRIKFYLKHYKKPPERLSRHDLD